MYLADTDIISISAPRRTGVSGLAQWMDDHSAELYLSVVSVAEIEDGIAKVRRERAHRKAAELTAWLDVLLHLYASRILALDLSAARIAGALSDLARSQGTDPGFGDIAIAATARRHGLTILTRNTKHFVPLGVQAINPHDGLPP